MKMHEDLENLELTTKSRRTWQTSEGLFGDAYVQGMTVHGVKAGE